MYRSLFSQIMLAVLSLAAEIVRGVPPRLFTKDALVYCRTQRQTLGRPFGRKNNRHKIGKAEAREIKKRLKAGENKTAIAKALGVSRNTLYLGLHENNLQQYITDKGNETA